MHIHIYIYIKKNIAYMRMQAKLLGDVGYRLQQYPCASAEEVGQWAFKHLGSEQCGLCERRAKSCTGNGRRWGSEPRVGVGVSGKGNTHNLIAQRVNSQRLRYSSLLLVVAIALRAPGGSTSNPV
jgi:hypothetical protein